MFVLVGIAIATLIFTLFPSSHAPHRVDHSISLTHSYSYFRETQNKISVLHRIEFGSTNLIGKVPLGLKRKGLRIVVTGGARFVESHLVDRLIARRDSVIVVDNFFTGRKENLMHHFGNPNFELIRHDVVEPLLLEVD